MKKLLLFFLCLAAPLLGHAASSTLITATIAITNTAGTSNGMTLTVNGDVRTWTNSVVIPATQILTNSTIAGSATNLFQAIAAAPFSNLGLGPTTTGITLQTLVPNGALSVILSTNWGTVTFSTNTLTSAIVVRVPITVEYSSNQVTIATYLAQGLESSTYGISATAVVLQNMVNLTQAQSVTGQKTFLSPIETNGVYLNPFLDGPTSTNGINRGNAFSSPGSGLASEQFGNSSQATGIGGIAFGVGATASGSASIAVGSAAVASNYQASAFGFQPIAGGVLSEALGNSAKATNTDALAVGTQSLAGQTNATAIGVQASATGLNSLAVGEGAVSAFDNSAAIGQGVTSTSSNQVTIGNSSQSTIIPGGLQVGTISNSVFGNTNNFPAGSDLAFGRKALTTIANGNNAGVVVGTNIFVELSGPSGAFTINGIAGGRDGKYIILLNRTGQNMTLANDSGVEPTSANRLFCLSAADKTITGNSSATLIYSTAASHWIVLNFSQ